MSTSREAPRKLTLIERVLPIFSMLLPPLLVSVLLLVFVLRCDRGVELWWRGGGLLLLEQTLQPSKIEPSRSMYCKL